MSDDPEDLFADEALSPVSIDPNAPHLVVAGSLNIDYVMRVGRLPNPGETIAAAEMVTNFGGKGANQAVAAARQEIEVTLIGSLGDDEMARPYRTRLENEGINVDLIKNQPGVRSGSAFIAVDDEGENTIIVSPGANAITSVDEIHHAEAAIQKADALLAQFEIPISTIVEAVNAANLADVTVILNPSPIRTTFPWSEIQSDYVIVNESEAIELLDFLPGQIRDLPMVRQQLDEFNIGTLVITRGSDPTLVYPEFDDPFEVPTMAVLPIDTVGAGDAFAGCFASQIARGVDLRDAVRSANVAGALTTLGAGAQSPIPDLDQVEQHVQQFS